jgi:hypothetical protein
VGLSLRWVLLTKFWVRVQIQTLKPPIDSTRREILKESLRTWLTLASSRNPCFLDCLVWSTYQSYTSQFKSYSLNNVSKNPLFWDQLFHPWDTVSVRFLNPPTIHSLKFPYKSLMILPKRSKTELKKPLMLSDWSKFYAISTWCTFCLNCCKLSFWKR